MIKIDATFRDEFANYATSGALECFNCGTCAAICPLMDAHYPRKMIRYIQLGARERIMENYQALWRCLHCGLCTQTCPRGADPGEIMLGLKRYVFSKRRNL